MKIITTNSEQQLNEMVVRAINNGNFAQKITDGGITGARILNPHEEIVCKIVVK